MIVRCLININVNIKIAERKLGYGKAIVDPEGLTNEFKNEAKMAQEGFWVIGFNIANKRTFKELLFLGGYVEATVDIRVIFKQLLLNDCVGFAVVHNHPTGDVENSEQDLELTKILAKAGKMMNIRLYDHLIIGEDEDGFKYNSFAENKWKL